MANPQGMQWKTYDGSVSTTASGRKVWAAALSGAGEDNLSKRVAEGKFNWRKEYAKYVLALADEQAKSKQKALQAAAKGLQALCNEMQYCHSDGKCYALAEAAAAKVPASDEITTVEHKGQKAADDWTITVPISDKQTLTEPADIIGTIRGWARYGSCEESFADAIAEVLNGVTSGELRKELKQTVFVLLGATSAAGPAHQLLNLGATVVAVSRPGAKLQQLIEFAKETPGTLLVPQKKASATPGADVMTELPALSQWIAKLIPGARLVIGSYIYLDGEAHVRACVTCDLLSRHVLKHRSNTAMANIGTPSIAHVISSDAHSAAQRRYQKAGVFGNLNPLRWCYFQANSRPAVKCDVGSGREVYLPVTNGLINFQGPNYALAKTMQMWSAMLLKEEGVVVSTNLGPPMYTESVTHVPAALAALHGFQGFPPLVAFRANTVSALLALLLVWDITNPKSTASPSTPLDNPMQLFVQNGFHGGTWRCPYTQQSIGPALFALGKCWYTSQPSQPASA